MCSPRFEAAKEKDEPLDDEAQEMQRKKKKEKKSAAKKKPQHKGKEKTKPQKRRRSSSATRRSGSDADGEWREAWKKGGSAKAKSDYSDGEDNGGGEEDGESGYESSKSVRDEQLTDDESFSSSESTSSSSSAPSSGIKKKGKAILEFISRDRIKRDDEADGEPHRPSWLWRKGSREKVTERDNVITSTAAAMDDLSLYDRESLNSSSQQSPRVRCLPHAMDLAVAKCRLREGVNG